MTDRSSFGYKHLQKEGWSEGDGLGKRRSGNSAPIKVFLKHDTAGLGHDAGRDFTNQWWDHVFNKAAAKISVTADGEEVKVKSNELTEERKTKLKHKTLYGNFVKSATLKQGKETPEGKTIEREDNDGSKPLIPVLTDEELLKACGGRTAHKGARHGFKMNGKLARVEQQDINTSNKAVSSDSDSSQSTCSPKLKKKKHKKEKIVCPVVEEDVEPEAKRQKKKKRKHKEQEVEAAPNSDNDISNSENHRYKKSKSRRAEDINDTQTDGMCAVEVEETVTVKKKKKKDKYNKKNRS